jgi:hypothetical protein
VLCRSDEEHEAIDDVEVLRAEAHNDVHRITSAERTIVKFTEPLYQLYSKTGEKKTLLAHVWRQAW